MQALGLVWGEVDSRAPDYRERSNLIDGPAHPGAQLTLAAWQSCAEKGGFVIGRDIPSRRLSGVLRNLAIYQPLEGGKDFRVRLAGTAFYRRFGRDITGQRFSELFEPDVFEARRDALLNVLWTGRPACVDVERVQGTRAQVHFELLLLPVLAADGRTPWALSGMFFHDWVS